MLSENKFETLEDFRQALLTLCTPLEKYYKAGGAQIDLGATGVAYPKRTAMLESFARPFWGLIPFLAGGGDCQFGQFITEGIKHGTAPHDPLYWGDCKDGDQSFVEMTVFAVGLFLAPQYLWEPLSETERKNFNRWLLQINEKSIPPNNWLFFRVLVNCGLKRVGGTYDPQQIEKDLAAIDGYYLGDGWYSDGKTLQRDYYIAFAIHFYSLFYAKVMKDEDPERCKCFIERARLFAQDFIYWFSDDGDALVFGRSLTYRFAQSAFWSALAFADTEVFSWGVMKGIIARNMRWWMRQPIFDGEGKLTIGYRYPNLNMAEGYNAPGSPYWSFKTFLLLAIPEEHPFWQAKEEPLPPLQEIKPMKHPIMVLSRPQKGHVVALTAGQYAAWEPMHWAEKYEKFAYSNYFGFCVPRSYSRLEQAAPDNMLVFIRDGMHYVRRQCQQAEVRGNTIYSKWSPFAGVCVETTVEPFEKGHIRTHKITAEFDCEAAECGFSLRFEPEETLTAAKDENKIELENAYGISGIQCLTGESAFEHIICEANTNLLYNRIALPYLSLKIKKGTTTIASYVYGIRK